jgi:peptidoglycan hydrolase-like protein with peptidoglycan-binding domain
MTMRALVVPMAAVFFVVMAGPALADKGGNKGNQGNHGSPGNHSNRGGAERGLDRADQAAGQHGDKGRDNARTRGNHDRDVTSAQRALKNKGFDSGSVDGRMGHRTRGSLMAFQKAEGLNPTGRLDAATRIKLGL